jgi:hypothetical protein
MKAVLFSETSMNFFRAKRHHMTEENALLNHLCDNLKSNIKYTYF